ncbi:MULTISPECIES: hypothetical protein [Leptospira]|uniref:DUF4376 domain-containing protein n=1 Tax=Leptospira borgpetersenii serovar Javanica str. UI 09931 TaxID=1049767 RepID=A0AAV3J7X7_LEPBO|nr:MULTISPECIES: hypothetical protein [Leptospira]EMN59734.1 hypothetical protein LEP1GSC090_2712 [Leptospira borgpetersenii serovar Javanica str. MK146]EPG56115.1 hypothetical protein LEP1GSC103_0671 [Leptospira borgpetersenii serovar Javanica str. UI 09931]MDQ7245906.1 hypothetical protein [Leptospira borgpetersenii]PTM48105.1 hypothetical protein CLV95_1092 [Leptospira borgpetersenii serovar Javanica]GIM19661.1 hypothetical protein KHM09_21120 [Leptospira borgpetersenii]
MNYILDKETKSVVWINSDPDRLSGSTAWTHFDQDLHEVVFALNYNPMVGEKFKADIIEGQAIEFVQQTVYNKNSGAERILQNWDDTIISDSETPFAPLKDEFGLMLAHQVFSDSGWIIDLTQKRDSFMKLIESVCEKKIVAGFISNALGVPHFYKSDRDDQLNLIGLASLNESFPYRCTDKNGVNEYRLHSSDQFKQVSNDGAIRKTSLLQNSARLKLLLQSANTIEELDQIEINSGWE